MSPFIAFATAKLLFAIPCLLSLVMSACACTSLSRFACSPSSRRISSPCACAPGGRLSLHTATMLDTIPAFVKPFFPQLQRTFVKATADPSSLAVRTRAAGALGSLMRSQPRVDPVVTELVAGAKTPDNAIAASHVNALAHVVKSAGQNVGEKAREACVELVSDAFRDPRDGKLLVSCVLASEM